MNRWQKARGVLIAALATYYFVSSLFGSGGDIASAKGIALLALGMAWSALDQITERNDK